MYSPTVLDHFQNPRNVGDLPDADAAGEAGNPVNGNSLTLWLKIAGERIEAARFRAFGCAATIAAGSKMTEWVIGKTVEEALTIDNDTIAGALGGLPPTKRHCSVLAADAIRASIAAYKSQIAQNRHDMSIETPQEKA